MTDGFAYTRGRVRTAALTPNTGQVEGLPANPRKWSKKEVERLAAEREKAEREKAEREKAIVWELSERERKIIDGLAR